MSIYNYTQATAPNLQGIKNGIDDSEMTDKSYEGGTWDESTEDLAIHFDGDLSAPDKTILDGIVADPPEVPPTDIAKEKSPDGSTWEQWIDDEGIVTTEKI